MKTLISLAASGFELRILALLSRLACHIEPGGRPSFNLRTFMTCFSINGLIGLDCSGPYGVDCIKDPPELTFGIVAPDVAILAARVSECSGTADRRL